MVNSLWRPDDLHGDQTCDGSQMTFSRDQTLYGIQMKNLSDDQTHNEGQMTALKGSYTMTFTDDQIFTEGQMALIQC